MEKAEKEESEAKKTKTQNLGIMPDSTPKIGDAFKRMTKVELHGKKQTHYDKKLLEFLACHFIPFGAVDSEEFKNFVEELDKSINLKNSRTYSRQMEQLAAEVSQSINMFCSGFLNICLMINHNNNPGAGGREEGSH